MGTAATLAGCVAASPSECPAARRLYNGACCAPWTTADLDVCVVREWLVPTPNDAIGAAGARDPEVALDDRDRVVLAWTQADDTTTAVALALEQPDGQFALVTPGEGLLGDGNAPSLATDDRGRVLLSWRQQLGEAGEIYYAERGVDGALRLPPQTPQLSFSPTAYEPRSVYAEGGETLVVYNQWTGSNFGVAVARRASDDLDGDLQRPATDQDVLSPPILFANAPVPAVASNGDAIITWYQSPGTSLMTFVSERFGPQGAFSHPAADAFISVDGAPVDSHPESNPAPAIDDHGAAVVGWTQDDGEGHTPVFLASRDGWGRWSLPTDLRDAFSVPAGAARCVQTAFGGDGSLYVTWYEEAPDHGLAVFAAHRAAGGMWVESGRAAVLLSDAHADAVHPALAVGDEGQALIAYTQKNGERWDLVVRRRNPDTTAWLPPEVLSGELSGDASEPTVAWRHDTFVVAWVQGTLRYGQMYVARVPSAGAAASD